MVYKGNLFFDLLHFWLKHSLNFHKTLQSFIKESKINTTMKFFTVLTTVFASYMICAEAAPSFEVNMPLKRSYNETLAATNSTQPGAQGSPSPGAQGSSLPSAPKGNSTHSPFKGNSTHPAGNSTHPHFNETRRYIRI
ncbi:uncharacterized protein PRCAT00004873001 [Priceomyces carsonii]|uniref:uncharacterized protein n=1 Tax=Priceomyces carsonii TaxID=28549 RepID=UPI002ED8366C|nr:unnamed protein product [Priceomyces carsonii]